MSCIRKIRNYINKTDIISIPAKTKSSKYALVSYIISPFLDENIQIFHSNVLECKIIVKTLLDLGYNVDIINWDNETFIPQKKYSLFLDIHNNMERLHNRLDSSTIKILYATGAHWLYQNHAEYSRLIDIQKRKGYSLVPRRYSPPCRSIEYSDYVIILGKKTAYESFQYANKPLFPVDLLSIISYDWNDKKDFDAARKNFLWLGGKGLAHKGLDLVLDTFSELPNLELFICANIIDEPDFEELYHKELYNTENIHYLGWININSSLFSDVLQKCGSIVFPSCSEAQSPSVITCMHGGLIPIISTQCGLDIDNFGVELNESSIEEIKSAVYQVANLKQEIFEKYAKMSWESARKIYNVENYSKKIKEIIKNIEILRCL